MNLNTCIAKRNVIIGVHLKRGFLFSINISIINRNILPSFHMKDSSIIKIHSCKPFTVHLDISASLYLKLAFTPRLDVGLRKSNIITGIYLK
ncbi:MAG: hypothetical protein U0J30_06245, partial [Megasphaera sp.]|nr:hypothetical protein [Megasphaera sp.]